MRRQWGRRGKIMPDGYILDIPYRVWGEPVTVSENPYKVLFLCTGNSCRSILAEAILNEVGKGRFIASSAGSQPAGYVHPHALACLNHNRIPVQQPHSKTWDEFADTELDLVVTVCDNAAGETCPAFPGGPARVHWGLPDPALASGSDAEVAEVFQAVFDCLHDHISRFVDSVEQATPADKKADLGAIAEKFGAPEPGFTINPAA
jgi:arsenate reductase